MPQEINEPGRNKQTSRKNVGCTVYMYIEEEAMKTEGNDYC